MISHNWISKQFKFPHKIPVIQVAFPKNHARNAIHSFAFQEVSKPGWSPPLIISDDVEWRDFSYFLIFLKWALEWWVREFECAILWKCAYFNSTRKEPRLGNYWRITMKPYDTVFTPVYSLSSHYCLLVPSLHSRNHAKGLIHMHTHLHTTLHTPHVVRWHFLG